MKNFLFADETEFWLRLKWFALCCEQQAWIEAPSCLAEVEEFWPAMELVEM